MKFLFADNAKTPNLNFEFPDGGWSCSGCRNYNFKGREICNRCNKSKDTLDADGLPTHLANHNVKKAEKYSEGKASTLLGAKKPYVKKVKPSNPE
jgi:hypothetical protein